MATKEARGSKRICQNEECGAKFYDLNRDPIVCPICQTVFELAPLAVEEEPEPAPAPAPAEAQAAVPTAAQADDAGDGDEVTDDDALVSLDDADAELEGETVDGDDEDDNTFLETDDDEGGDVTGIIGPVGGNEEET